MINIRTDNLVGYGKLNVHEIVLKLTYFKIKEECAKAYDKAMLEVDPEHCVLNFPIPQNQRNVYISYHTLKEHLADIH